MEVWCSSKDCFVHVEGCMGPAPMLQHFAPPGLHIPNHCNLCPDSMESTSHVILECSLATQVWRQTPFPNSSTLSTLDALLQAIIRRALRSEQKTKGNMICYISYHIWLAKNGHIFHITDQVLD